MEKDKTPKRSSQLHAGHRSRVRKRFLTSGLDSFQDHEVLEFLLFYAVPRRDVNEMAHMLMARFGSLSGVLDAPEDELCTIPGVGPRVAHFLNLIPEIMVQMSRQSYTEAPILRGPKSLERIMAHRCPHCPAGHILLILIDSVRAVVSIHLYPSFEAVTAREIAAQASNSRAAAAVLVERVENCVGFPLPGRLQALKELTAQMNVLEIPLLDYYTVDFLGHEPHSFARSGQLLPL